MVFFLSGQRICFYGSTFVIYLILFSFGNGCHPSPTLSSAAVSFKKIVQEVIAELTPPLVEPVAAGHIEAINRIMVKLFAQAENDGKPIPFKIALANPNGIVLTSYPLEKIPSRDFSEYAVVAQAKEGKIIQTRFYLANGSKLYVVVAPLRQAIEIKGFIGLYLFEDELQGKWGLKEQDFLSLDFNK